MKGGELPVGTFRARSDDGEDKPVSRALCPIIRSCPETGKFTLVGTGFFITAYGIVMTAKHVLQDVFDRNGKAVAALGIVQFFGEKNYILRHFLRYQSYSNSDVAVAIAAPAIHNVSKKPLLNEIFKLDASDQPLGEPIVTCAYPNSNVHYEDPIHHFNFRADYYEGKLEEWFSEGRDKVLLPNPCWRTNMHIHEGASGGPVCNKKGLVVGINSTSFGEKSHSYVSSIAHALNLSIEIVVPPDTEPRKYTLRELAKLNHIFVKD